jgi:hypothetical protein
MEPGFELVDTGLFLVSQVPWPTMQTIFGAALWQRGEACSGSASSVFFVHVRPPSSLIAPKWLRGKLTALLFRRCDLPIQIWQDNLANHILVLPLCYFQIFEKLSEMVARRKQSFSALV